MKILPIVDRMAKFLRGRKIFKLKVVLFNMEFKLREVTPKSMRCGIGACPGIIEKTPKDMICVLGACDSIHASESSYLIVGKNVNPAKFNLQHKVGEGEVMIEVPKKLIDEKEK